ncbi:MAG: (d)CMP kinase [Candidatus Gallimonas sp.]
MLFIEKNVTPHHVYLRGAKSLRKDISQKFNVAIDGPAGSGKSTLAKALAKDYKILYLDTGAMYRACALYALEHGVDLANESAVCDMMQRVDLSVVYQDGEQHTCLGGKDVSSEIREPRVSMAASVASKYPCVRVKMVEKQREIAGKMSCVLDGRDIGSFVLPDADFKFYLTASAEVRARRRFVELKAKGYDVNFDDLKREIEARDLQDSAREFSPLKKADDAIEIDSSEMTAEQVLAEIKKRMQEKI